MKKITFVLFLLVLSNLVIAQVQSHMRQPEVDKSYYLRKAKHQRTWGIVTAATGGVVALVGGFLTFASPIAGLSETGDVAGARRTGQRVVAVGGGIMALSIPMFIASGKNERKAKLYVSPGQAVYLPQGVGRQLSVGVRIGL